MFKNRAVQVSLVNKSKNAEVPTVVKTIDMDQVDELAQIALNHAEQASRILLSVYLAKKIIDTSSTVAIIAAQGKFIK